MTGAGAEADTADHAIEAHELLVVTGAGHNDIPEIGDAAYWRWLERAIDARPTAATRGAEAGTRSEP